MLHNKYFQIMSFFLSDYTQRIYGRQLVGKIDISQKGIALCLKELGKLDILSAETEGKQKYYSLNKNNQLVKQYILQAEIYRSQQFLVKHPKLNLALKELNAKTICVFGSFARGKEKDASDVDIFVIGCKRNRVKEVGNKYDLNLSEKIYTEQRFIKSLKDKNHLISEIVSNHIIVKGFEEFIDCIWRYYYGNKH